jgi:hypothetical protein
MPFTETGSEKAKREAYMKANKERGIRQEQKRDYEMFGTTEQNIPKVDTMGNVTGMKKGGKVMDHKHKMEHDKKHASGFMHEQEKAKKHSSGFKMHHEQVKSMCGGGYMKGKK